MKAQHRHELQTNQLAELLEAQIDKVKPYTQAIIGVVVAAMVLLGVYFYLRHMDRSAEQAASDQLVAAIQPGIDQIRDLQATIENHPDTQQATIAQLVMGEELLRAGADQLFTNKAEGNKNLGKAADAFLAAESGAKDQMLKAWALFGLGRAHESQGKLDQARKDYERLKKEYPNSSLADDAEQHLKNLDKQSTKEFYDWFAKQDPRPVDLQREPGIPGQKPIFDLSDPTAIPSSSSNLNFPSSLDGITSPSTPDSSKPEGAAAPGDVPAEPMPPTTPAEPASTQPGGATDKDAPSTDAAESPKSSADSKPAEPAGGQK